MRKKDLIWNLALATAALAYILASLWEGLQSPALGALLVALMGHEVTKSIRMRHKS